jgi:hypothetical protein
MWADNGPVTFNAASPEKKPEDTRPPSQKWDPPVVSGVLNNASRHRRNNLQNNKRDICIQPIETYPTQPNLISRVCFSLITGFELFL